MSEWWTYTLTDFLLFSPRTYYRLFELYNTEVWPLQIVALALGVAIMLAILRGAPWSGRAIAIILAALWLFVAWAYLLERYDTINWAARYYALGFALQAGLLVLSGVIRNRLAFKPRGVPAWIGLALLLYALAIHPLIAPLAGRPWTQAEIFGLAPDPTAIGTLGVLVAAARAPIRLAVLPLLWCAISALTLWTMESPEAPVVALTAVLAAAAVTWNMRSASALGSPSPDG
jgi:Family of unknown function (DUF6064)